ncbi:MAG: YaaR family protein [Treponema sp.]|nr:YaaR family protein [Treponema sp.]
MAEVEGLGNNSLYFASLQAASSAAVRQNKTEKAKESGNVKKSRFADILKKTESENVISTKGLPPEIEGMNMEEAGIFLRDAVDAAGENLKNNITAENLKAFKEAVAQFVSFVVENNFEEYRKDHPQVEKAKRLKRPEPLKMPVNVFSNYNITPEKFPQRVRIQVINQKLDEITRDVLKRQSDNLKILSNIDEVKGLVVDILNG